MSAIIKRINTHRDSCASNNPSEQVILSPMEARQQKKETMDKEQTKLSEHFTLEELCATSHKEFQKKNLEYGKTIKTRLENLANFLEEVSVVCDSPLLITSGVRCPELNKAVGGVATSQHVTGHAADIIPQKNGSVQDHFCKIFKSHLIYDQLILEETKGKIWIHISYKGMNGRREALYYNGKKYVKYVG
jgi:hypothetical protein